MDFHNVEETRKLFRHHFEPRSTVPADRVTQDAVVSLILGFVDPQIDAFAIGASRAIDVNVSIVGRGGL